MIKIDKYISEIEGGKIVFYAVAGKKRYKMNSAYSDMFNSEYMAIQERTLTRPELFESTDEKEWIPLRTSA